MAGALIGGSATWADAKPGALDRSFGYRGKTLTLLGPGKPRDPISIQAAIAPNGDIFVSDGTRLARYLPEGRLDRGFGNGGLVNVEMPEGLSFWLGDLAVDSQGRAIVIGTATERGALDPRTAVSESSIPSLAAFARYGNDGSLDPAFGNDGVVLTEFGPQADDPPYSMSTVTATLGAVDSAGRLTAVAGTRDLAVPCTTHPHFYRFDKAIVRLTPAGELDTTFGEGGFHMLEPPTDVTALTLGEGDEPILTSAGPGCGSPVRLVRLAAEGSAAQETPAHEHWPRGIAVDPHGRTVLLGKTAGMWHRGRSMTHLVRLDRDGNLDRSFGRNGVASVSLRGRLSTLNALATDSTGALLLVGASVRQPGPRHGAGAPFRRSFVGVRLLPSGMLDPRFGNDGVVVTRFGAHASAAGRQALVDPANRLVAVGSVRVNGLAARSGVALARYLGRP